MDTRTPGPNRVFRALLRLLPLDFRSAYGREMELVFRAQRDEHRHEGRLGLARLWWDTLRDLLRTAPREHVAMLRQDAAYALRMMRREKAFALAAVAILALGIGANTAIFSVVDAVMLRPLPFPAPERLFFLWGDHHRIGHETASMPDFADWRAQNDAFERMSGFIDQNLTISTAGGEAERVVGARVTDGFFRVLGVAPAAGRDFRAEEDRPGAARVVVLGDGLWRRMFGADPSILGRPVTIEGYPYTVVGIAPRGFAFPEKVELWSPLAVAPNAYGRRNDFLTVIGRLKPGVSVERARSTMRTIAARLERQYPDTNVGWSVAVVPALDQIVGNTRPALVALWVAVGFLLLIACSNVANLLVARGAARAREMAVRSALGAGASRLVRQSLTESVMFAVFGGGLGLLVAAAGIRLLVRFGPEETPRLHEAGLDPQVLLFTLVVSLVTGVLFGMIPAARAGRDDLQPQLKEGGAHGDGPGRAWAGNALVAVQVAVSVILLVGAALMVRSVSALTGVDPGFRTEAGLTLRVSLPAGTYGSDGTRQRAFFDQLIERLERLPGVRAAGGTTGMYLSGGASYLTYSVEGIADPPPDSVPDAQVRRVTPGLHRALGVPLVRGRLFTRADSSDARRVAVVNLTFARRFKPNGDIIGRRISYRGFNGQPVWHEVVGIIGDVRQTGLDEAVYPEIQVPFAQDPTRAMTLVLASDAGVATLVGPVRQQVRELDGAVPVFDVRRIGDTVGRSVATRRSSAYLLGVFAVMALVLAACGLYGVVAYRVARSRREIGVRMAMGAGPSSIVTLVLRRGMTAAFAGLALGVPAAWFLSEYLQSLLYGIPPHDGLTFAIAAIMLLVTCALACSIPAIRATRVDPLVALRTE